MCEEIYEAGSTPTKTLVYNYGDNGLVGFTFNNTEYFYIRNAQSDIIGILNSAGNVVVEYTYDSWGQVISIEGELKDTVGVINPYRYRGYRYDNETGLYYLQSRYYNPEWGRFINADGITGVKGELLSHNMFAYCANNPVNMKDPSGFAHMIATESGGGGGSLLVAVAAGGLKDFVKGIGYAIVGSIIAIATGAVARNFIDSISYSKSESKTQTISEPLYKKAPKTQIVYRVWGQDINNPLVPYSGPWGHSWTPVNPGLITDYRNLAGLPGGQCGAVNAGRYVSVGIVLDMTGVTKRAALPLDGNSGGIEEWLFPAPQVQILIIGVYGVNPEF